MKVVGVRDFDPGLLLKGTSWGFNATIPPLGRMELKPACW